MKDSNPFDIIVVGVGAMGAATCMELARRGVRVLGLEQFDIPHARGSSHGLSRMIRLCYYEHPDYVPLLGRAYALWNRVERESERKLLHVTGGVYIGRAGGELVSGSLESARRHGLTHEFLDGAQLADRFPQFQLPSDHVALYEPMAGWLAPEKCVSTFAELALRHGAYLHAHEPVRAWSADASGVTVTTDRGTYRAAKLIFCGGAWTSALLRDAIRARLTVTRQVMTWLWPRRPERFVDGQFPVWAVGQEDGTLHYGFPLSAAGDGVGLKLAHHARGPATDPDRVARDPRPEDERDIRAFVARVLPDADGPLMAQRVCLYTNSPDSHFILDRHPQHENVHIACGFSGHGFKFASVIGEVLADLSTRGATKLPIEFLSLRRYSSG